MPLPYMPKKAPRTTTVTVKLSPGAISALKTLCDQHNLSQPDALESLLQQEMARTMGSLPALPEPPYTSVYSAKASDAYSVKVSDAAKIAITTLAERYKTSQGKLIESLIMAEFKYFNESQVKRNTAQANRPSPNKALTRSSEKEKRSAVIGGGSRPRSNR